MADAQTSTVMAEPGRDSGDLAGTGNAATGAVLPAGLLLALLIGLATVVAGRRRARPGRWGAWGLLAAGLIVTVVAALHSKAEVDAVARREFAYACHETRLHIEARMAACTQILHSAAGLLYASDTVEREDWRTFVQALQIDRQLPGIQGVGFARLIAREQLAEHLQAVRREGFADYQLKPAGEREVYSAIVYLEPFAGLNLRAFGYDMFSEPVRRAAMERARDENAAALSGRVVLVQETGADVQAGTLLYVPVYRHGLPRDTVAQRRAAVVGWVYSPFRMTDLMRGALGNRGVTEDSRRISLEIYDGATVADNALLYSSQRAAAAPPPASAWVTQLMPLELAGHRWSLRFALFGGPAAAGGYGSVWLVLAGGTSVSLLVCGLLLSLLGTRAKADRMAAQSTAELRESAEALHQTTQRLRMAVLSGGVGIWDYDVVNNRLVWDEQMLRLYGIAQEQFGGAYEAWQAGVHPDDRQRGNEAIQAALQGAKDFDIEFRVLWPDGTTHHIRGFASVQRDAAGRALRMIGTNWDITDQKQTDEALRMAMQAAESANRAKSAFLANMSHEIRTPMNAIRGFSQLLLRDATLSDGQRQQLTIITRSGQHLMSIITDVLEMTRLGSGRVATTSTAFDLHQLLDNVEHMFGQQARTRSLRFGVERPGELPHCVVGDETKLHQVLGNLLGNAIQFTPEGGAVTLRVGVETERDGTLRLHADVEDNGPGIDAEDIPHLFQPFFQTHTGRQAAGGTGLGLAISREFVQLMGGDLTFSSCVGGGSRFRFSVQLVPADAAAVAAVTAPTRRVLHLRPGVRPCRVLVTDDQEENREMLEQLLTAIGFQVHAAANGEDTLTECQAWSPHLVLLDLRMPGMDGCETARRIRAAHGPAVKLIAVSASESPESRQEAMAAGVDAFHGKPVEETRLLEQIRQLLGVDYLYADARAAEAVEATAEPPTVEEVLRVAGDLAAQLREATCRADYEQMRAIVDQIAARHEGLGRILRDKMERFEYDAIRELLPPTEKLP